MLEASLERLVEILTSEAHSEDLARARLQFFGLTGEFEAGERWYEARIQYFFDWYLSRFVDPSAHPALAATDLSVLAACARSLRGLFRTDERLPDGRWRLIEEIGGGAFRVTAARLQDGDRFDGRLIALGDAIHLAPGMIFHPPEAHPALDEIVARVRESGHSRDEVLDGLLRMRMRLDRFTSMRAEHVYRFDGLGDAAILSAAWARRE